MTQNRDDEDPYGPEAVQRRLVLGRQLFGLPDSATWDDVKKAGEPYLEKAKKALEKEKKEATLAGRESVVPYFFKALKSVGEGGKFTHRAAVVAMRELHDDPSRDFNDSEIAAFLWRVAEEFADMMLSDVVAHQQGHLDS